MDDQHRSPRIGRLAGLLLVGCGVLSVATLPLPQSAGIDRDVVLALSAAAIAVGATACFLPWHRWHPRVSLALLPIAFALISAGNYFGNAQPYTYSVFFIVAFVWIGLGHPRWTSMAFVVPAAVAYVLPIVLRPQPDGPGAASALLVIPVCAFVAESIAWTGARERRSREQSAALARVALALGPHLNVGDLGQTLASELRMVLHAERAAFFLVRDRIIEHVFSAGFPDEARTGLEALTGNRLEDAPGVDELEAGRPVVAEDARRDSPLIDSPSKYGLRSYVAVPVIVEDALRGVLTCTERAHARRYRSDDIRSVQALAAQAAAALRNALLYERTLEASQSDHLTGLGNRRAFHEQLSTEMERARRYGRRLSVLVLDVDHLKQVNDVRGHVAGDEALERVSRLVRDGSRLQDGVYRIGGDEFAIVLPETGPEQASVAAERIRVMVERGRVEVDGSRDLTVSIGAGSFPEDGINGDELFERADAALYEVKRSGRNAVRAATPTPGDPACTSPLPASRLPAPLESPADVVN